MLPETTRKRSKYRHTDRAVAMVCPTGAIPVLAAMRSRGLVTRDRMPGEGVTRLDRSGWYHAANTFDRDTGEPRGPRWIRRDPTKPGGWDFRKEAP